MPVALGALHRCLAERRLRWLGLFAASLLIQAIACSYYFLFILVLLGLWSVWFLRRPDLAIAIGIAIAVALVAAAISPLALPYLAIHERYGMTRLMSEIVTLSADVTSIVTAPAASVLWGWTSALNGSERQLFPGATALGLVVVAAVAAGRLRPPPPPAARAPLVLLAVAGVFAAVALFALLHGQSRLGPISIGAPHKPFSLAFYAAVGALLASAVVREAFRRQSLLAFYALAAAAMFVFALGPAPAFLHRQILYEPPYAWLMRLDIFREGVRVPARFGMLMVLALSAAAALAFARLVPSSGLRARLLLAAFAAAMLADGWIRPVPMLAAPPAWPPSVRVSGAVATLELPLGETTHDVAAMYRSVLTGLPTVNGYSGYFPPHYEALRLALEERDESALDYLAARGPLIVVVERGWPYARERLGWLRSLAVTAPGRPTAAELAADGEHVWFLVRAGASAAPACDGARIPLAAATDWRGAVDLSVVGDGRDDTFWTSGSSQRVGDALILDLGVAARACSVRLTLGSHTGSYPRALSVATSIDGDRWDSVTDAKLGGAAVRAAIEQPRNAVIEIPLLNHRARYIRLQLIANQPEVGWLATEIAVTGSKAE
jgi:hypothetical protein